MDRIRSRRPRATALLALLALACANPESEAPVPPVEAAGASSERAPVAEVVQVEPVRRGELQSIVVTSGSVIARRTTPLGAAVPGRIQHIFVEVGAEVAADEPLLQIDPEPYAISLQDAEAGLELAKAEAADARAEAERTSQLAGRNMISKQAHESAQTRAAVTRARVRQAEARVERARHELSATLVRAPYAGSIVARDAHEGMMATVTPSATVVVLAETSQLEAVLDVPEASPATIRPGDAVLLWVEGRIEPLRAEVRTVNRRIDEQTRTYSVRVPVVDPEGVIKAGAFARAEISPTPRSDALLVDRSAIARREGRAYVFRVEDGVAEQVPVRIGVTGQSEVELASGVAAGDRVVVGDVVARLMDGARVEAVDVAAAPKAPSE